jgi:hypothetical protein
MELGEQPFVEPIPYPSLLPVAKPPPAGHPRAIAQLLWQSLPADPGGQHEQDAVQAAPVVQALAAWPAMAPIDDRQQRLDAVPQLVIDFRSSTGASTVVSDAGFSLQTGHLPHSVRSIKNADMRQLTQDRLDAIAAELNGRPRQTLGFKTPSQALAEALP